MNFNKFSVLGENIDVLRNFAQKTESAVIGQKD
jgi:hypothetical protein